jgi:hypothetical protein
MRGAGVDGTAEVGDAGRAVAGAEGAEATMFGDCGGACTTTAGGTTVAGRGGAGATGGLAGFSTMLGAGTLGAATTGRSAIGAAIGAATGGADGLAGCEGVAIGFATIAGAGTSGLGCGVAGLGAAGASFCCVMAFSTSPGREMCDKSILVLISCSLRGGGTPRPACAVVSDEPRRCARTFSASCSSRELECVFFSVTPTTESTSRMALLFTSSSLARSLIRTLLIRPFFVPRVVPRSSLQPHGVILLLHAFCR